MGTFGGEGHDEDVLVLEAIVGLQLDFGLAERVG